MAREPAWKKLVEELTRDGYESPYLDRLLARVDPEQALEDVEREIVQEMAASLGRAEERVNHALLELELADRRGDSDEEWRAIRDRAERLRRDLQIHREALGLLENKHLEAYYPIPRRRRERS